MMEVGFFLKKTLSYFLEPFGMLMSIFIIGLYFLFTKREGFSKIFLSFGFMLMFLYSYPPSSNFLVANLENQYPKYDYKTHVKYIHVLGSAHNTDKEQPLSSQIGNAGIKRSLEGIIIHLKCKDSKIIFTGYEGKTNTANAQMNTDLAIALGVNKDNIITNAKPKDTREEAEFTKTIVGKEPFILVTSATHMPRAMMLFESFGLHPIPAPTNFYKSTFKSYFRLPNVESLKNSQIAMHEYIGIIWGELKASILL
ncbi:MAG: uncharacterized SAM-binding protein YcdF (DUF218 family) [Sulfurimonas sp.]|jgi:uncharacterized SAM-binding protein YcdF (DUF218 family)|uniref:ElyC/SanA/YdcF family protein n=1 Tax=Sulfurimonas sp. TaxID=2022749 RepID=UPI0039E29D25